jgi:hypothetical protein
MRLRLQEEQQGLTLQMLLSQDLELQEVSGLPNQTSLMLSKTLLFTTISTNIIIILFIRISGNMLLSHTSVTTRKFT